jgi:rod shape-determining protein MreB
MFREWKEKIFSYLSNDIGIDLGTANTLVYMRGKGIVINEPSVVAVNEKTGQVVAVGAGAKRMLGRTPAHIKAIRPIVDGVISNFEVTEEMLAYLINKAEKGNKKFLGPRVVIGAPYGLTNVEVRAVRDAARNAGAREVYVVEEPMAAAFGIRLPVNEPVGNMIIDIGGGTSDIAIISLDGIVKAMNLKVAGDKLNSDIISYIRDEFQVLIGEKTAENLKIAVGSVMPFEEVVEISISGRDLITGLPREVIVSDEDVRKAMSGSVDTLINSIREVLETTPPEIISDVMRNGIYLVGGGALIRGLDTLLSDWLKIPVYICDDPLTAVARGTGIILENLSQLNDVIVDEENVLPPK